MDSNESRKIIAGLKEFCKALESEGQDPIRALEGYILSGDTSYLCVHKGYNRALKFEIARIDRCDIIHAILTESLNK